MSAYHNHENATYYLPRYLLVSTPLVTTLSGGVPTNAFRTVRNLIQAFRVTVKCRAVITFEYMLKKTNLISINTMNATEQRFSTGVREKN